MIVLEKLRSLNLAQAPAPGRPSHLSAASGLVRVGDALHVIADDEHFLGIFEGHAPGRMLRLFEGDLPDDKKARKKKKPDLEALMRLPGAHGALLAMGSGSKPNRKQGALIKLDMAGELHDPVGVIDLTEFFAPLEEEFPKLNIEGAVTSNNELLLFQRGNKKNSDNAVIRYALNDFMAGLLSGAVAALRPRRLDRIELGEVDGIPLCFTDAAMLPDGSMVFTAVAENTDDNYADGPCAGAAIGFLSAEGKLSQIEHLAQDHKIEGVEANADGNSLKLLLVSDADDETAPAGLFSATLRR